MRNRMIVGAFTAAALVVTGVYAQDALKSGPQKGDKIFTPFNPLNLTGAQADQKFCQV